MFEGALLRYHGRSKHPRNYILNKTRGREGHLRQAAVLEAQLVVHDGGRKAHPCDSSPLDRDRQLKVPAGVLKHLNTLKNALKLPTPRVFLLQASAIRTGVRLGTSPKNNTSGRARVAPAAAANRA